MQENKSPPRVGRDAHVANEHRAVTAFAGTTPDRAVVEPEAQAALVRCDAVVQHYVVVAGPG
jgi:hypothetical protein